MAKTFSTIAVALVMLVTSAFRASGSVSVTVPAGRWVTIPVAGAVRVEVLPADVATATADANAVRIYGIRPGSGTLILTAPDGIEARPIQVEAPSQADRSLLSQVGQCATLAPNTSTGPPHFSVDAPELALDWTPSSWRLEWTPPDVRILASSAFATPLQQLGIPDAWGLEVEWQDRWQFIAGDGMGLVGYHLPGAGVLAVGESAMGPGGFVDVALGDAKVSAVALKSQGGQLLSGAQAALNIGPVTVGYTTGQAGGSPTIEYRSGSVSASASTNATQGLQLGVGIGVTPAMRVDSSWASAGAWSVHLAVSIGAGGAPAGAARPDRAALPDALGASQRRVPACLP